jgi:uncharacterized membrane protein
VLRIVAWLGVVALAILATGLDSALLRGLCLPAVLLALAAGTRATRMALLCLAAAALIPLLLGYGETALALTPALIAALIAWIFARTLARGRRPLIARMIAAMDGVQMLQEPAIDRYARRLTALWAVYQGALALIGLLLAVHAWLLPGRWLWLPDVRLFGIVILPAAVAMLLLVEFALRPRLLPQAPQRSLPAFLRGVLLAWPAALED